MSSSSDHDGSAGDEPPRDAVGGMASGPANPVPASQTNAVAASGSLSEKTPDQAEAEKGAPRPDSISTASADESADKAEATKTERDAPANKQAASEQPTSRHVARAQLTSGIDGREPIDRIIDVFHSDNEPLRRLYYFTELKGLSGETVTHNWWHDGRRIAQVTSHVRSNSWRMSSSKKLIPSMAGPWRVIVTDSQGNTLSVAKFVYRVP